MPRRRIPPGRLRRWLRLDPQADLARLVGLHDDARDDLLWQAHRLLERGRPAEAERVYGAILALWPQSASSALLGRGACRQALGDLAGAEASYNAVLALEASHAYALTNRAELCLLTERSEQARRDLDQIAASPSSKIPADLSRRIEQLRARLDSRPSVAIGSD